MKTKKLVIAAIATFAMVTVSFAQQGMGRGQGRGMGRGMGRAQSYGVCRNLQTTQPIMIEGNVLSVVEQTNGQGRYAKGMHVFMNVEGKKSEIHLGPVQWLGNQGMKLNKGDAVKIKVFKGVYNGNPALIASEVTLAKGGKMLTLRDTYGAPMWRRSLDPDQRQYKNRSNRGRGNGRGSRGNRGVCRR
jgi:hypothetical protein